jgi:CHAT domain
VSGVEEADLRRLAIGLRPILGSLISDPVEAANIDAKIAEALAIPEGQAKRALRRALSSHPALRAWVLKQGVVDETRWRLLPEPPPPGSPVRSPEPPETGPEELRDDVPYTGGGRPEPGPPSPAVKTPPTRHLAVDLPERAPVGRRFSLLVRITLAAPDQGLSAGVKPFDVPPEGRDVFITVSAPGLAPQDDLEQDLHVPPAADSEPVRFGFVASRVGLHTVTVRAFAGGTFLGELAVQISVEVGAALEEGPTRMAGMGALASEPGEVTLQVSITDDGRYSFQLIGEALYPVELSRRLAGDPTVAVNSIVTELRSFAARTSPYTTAAMIRNRLQNLGVQLWADAVPEAIRRQFWAQADKIKSFTVASDLDTVPWELLYPADGDNDNGFLVEQFPVVRRVYGQGRVRKLPLASAAYVVPPGSPGNAIDEVQAVRRWLGAQVTDQGVVDQLEQLAALLTSAPSVLHFACHNQFDATTGSAINMAGGPLHPNDLAMMVQKRGLAAASPLVFFNACRTAGEIPGFVQMWGWAKQFMGAGAGAFIGSLWAVRSSSARVFADAFYQAFVADRMELGAASLHARRAIADDDGDPTWLAYTVYGNPAATIGEEAGT